MAYTDYATSTSLRPFARNTSNMSSWGMAPSANANNNLYGGLMYDDMTNGAGGNLMMPGSNGVVTNPMEFSAPTVSTTPALRPPDLGKSSSFMDSIGGWKGVSTILDGIGTLGQVWMGLQANRIARDQLDFQKKAYKTNLANQTKSYNTQISDRAAYGAASRRDPSFEQDYINRNKL